MFLLYYNVNFLSFLILIEFLIFLVFSVCELVLGLSLLVRINYEAEIKNYRFDLLIILLEIY